jgi:hypothetical protein
MIATIYRDVLTESLERARIAVTPDVAAQRKIEAAFRAAIPPVVPPRLTGQLEIPAVRAAFRSDAARLLVRLCNGMRSRSPFVAAIAEAAQAKT